ncbi:hypothetical protein UFOVP1020_22 [uncultured Caudovirales phage]|uniref:Uncharacterized protein n=1 Tax=uncultured Caudovirales phage TaxID=2100421 RepID=A0A6J5MV08_9CAUD|nr:hypothetical protein UFOVP512_27 [uncultured Caudovirales phage]CAB4178681.1 hypothetical protein UFOVP1020_22 [uncultured Caudovirales phage]CAB4187930.1 hypothetical protein UFOVP1170_17 [uncultured Caudovirales phage]CAB4220416.1 hypothetical protein UFOVP1621_28 [uncultured Caudovirales phage]
MVALIMAIIYIGCGILYVTPGVLPTAALSAVAPCVDLNLLGQFNNQWPT